MAILLFLRLYLSAEEGKMRLNPDPNPDPNHDTLLLVEICSVKIYLWAQLCSVTFCIVKIKNEIFARNTYRQSIWFFLLFLSSAADEEKRIYL